MTETPEQAKHYSLPHPGGAGVRAWLPLLFCLSLPPLLSSCSTTGEEPPPPPEVQDSAPQQVPDLSAVPDAVPRVEPYSKYGNPPTYEVNGKRYSTLTGSKGYVERGVASWYGTKFHGRRTSSGEPYDMFAMTAAHKSLPLPTYARVSNLENGQSVVLKINDRGPFHDNRIIDLSYAAAHRLGIAQNGTGLVEVRAIDPGTPAKPPTVAAEDPQTDSKPTLYLQVGAFSSRSNAERMRTRLEQAQIADIRITEAATTEHTVHRVRIGPLGSIEDADNLVAMLDELGIRDPHIVID